MGISPEETSDSILKNSWAAYGPGNSNHLEIVVMHETNTFKSSSAPKKLFTDETRSKCSNFVEL